MRHIFAITGLVFSVACGSGATSPTQPSTVVPQSVPVSATFTLRGNVYDTIGRPVPHATVAIVVGTRSGSTVTADERGQFEFSEAVSGTVSARASKPGYVSQTITVSHGMMQNPFFTPYFRLARDGPQVDLSGPVTLRFQIDPSCAESVPPQFWTRTYTTRIPPPQASSFAAVRLEGATFASSYGNSGFSDTIYMSFFGDELQMYMEDPPIEEAISSSERFILYGHASHAITEQETIMPFRGGFYYCHDGEYNCEVCQSGAHVLTLTR